MKYIVNNVVNDILQEASKAHTFQPGEAIYIQTPNERMGRKVLAKKYGENPDNFEYVGGGKWIYRPKTTNKKPKVFLGKKEGETEEEYLERLRSLNRNFFNDEQEYKDEQWRPIVNTGRYFGGTTDYSKTHEVSNMGRVRVIDFEDPMNSFITNGYDAPGKKARNVHVDIPGFKTTPPIHTLVADAWLEKPEGDISDYDVVHINGNYHDNRAANLMYVKRKGRKKNNQQTQQENKKMNKRVVRLTESDLHRIVKETVSKIIRESYDINNGHGAYEIYEYLRVLASEGDEDAQDRLNDLINEHHYEICEQLAWTFREVYKESGYTDAQINYRSQMFVDDIDNSEDNELNKKLTRLGKQYLRLLDSSNLNFIDPEELGLCLYEEMKKFCKVYREKLDRINKRRNKKQ